MIVPVPQQQNEKKAAPTGATTKSSQQGRNNSGASHSSTKKYDNGPNMDQIIRIDGGRGKFVELTKQAIALHNKNAEGLLRLNFVAYDTQSHKQTDFVSFYLSFSEWDKLSHSVINEEGEFGQKWADALSSGNQYATIIPPIYKGGQIKGQTISRSLTLAPGQKEGVLFLKATQGPGEATQTGLIKPAGRPTSSVGVPMKYEDLVAILMAGEKEIQAYKTAVACSCLGGISSNNATAPAQAVAPASAGADTAALEKKIDDLQSQVSQLMSMVKTLTSMIE